MTDRNDSGREVWFHRIWWSYMPTHWKGFVYPAPIIAVTIALCTAASKYSDTLTLAAFLPGWLSTVWLASRHSQSRR